MEMSKKHKMLSRKKLSFCDSCKHKTGEIFKMGGVICEKCRIVKRTQKYFGS
jgi:hypothetical protein